MARIRGLYPGISQRVEAIRAENGWTWDQFSSVTGVKKATLHGLKEGDPTPDADTAYRIANTVHRSVEWLLTGTESPGTAPSLNREALLEVIKVIRDADKQRKTPISDEVFADKLADAYERNLQAKRDIQEIAENE